MVSVNDHDFVEAEAFPNEMAAAVAAASLEARGIDCVVERQDSSGAAALTRLPEQVRVLVRSSELAVARQLLQGVFEADEDRAVPAEPTPASDQIVRGLQEIRRRRRHVWILGATYLPAAGFAMWAAPAAVPYVAGLWLFGIAVTVARAGYVRCPRCGNRFSRRRWGHNDFTQECLHCGLRLR